MKKKSIFGKQEERSSLIRITSIKPALLITKKPIKIIDLKKNLLGIGFINEEQTNLNPKLVLNAK